VSTHLGRMRAFAPDGRPLGFPIGGPAPQVLCTSRPPVVPATASEIPAPPGWDTYLIAGARATATGVSLTLVTTVAGKATITVSAGKRLVRSPTTTNVRAGKNALTVTVKLTRGTYTIKVVEQDARTKHQQSRSIAVRR
jgi:hypothetical protein